MTTLGGKKERGEEGTESRGDKTQRESNRGRKERANMVEIKLVYRHFSQVSFMRSL